MFQMVPVDFCAICKDSDQICNVLLFKPGLSTVNYVQKQKQNIIFVGFCRHEVKRNQIFIW